MIRMIDIPNWKATNTFLNDIPPPIFSIPLRTFIGWKEDINNAGYIPEINPTTNGMSRSGTMIVQFRIMFIFRSCPDILFNHGSATQVNPNAANIESQETRTDSVSYTH